MTCLQQELIVFIGNKLNFSSFNSYPKFFKADEVTSFSNGGCRTIGLTAGLSSMSVSIKACGALEGGSTPLTRPIFLNSLFCENNLILDSSVSVHHHC